MKKIYNRIIADILLFLHVIWTIVLAGGTVFIFYHRWYIPYHLTIIAATALSNLILGGCPLTRLEERHRKAWNPDTFYCHNSFAATYAERFFGIDVTPKQADRVLILIKVFSCSISVLLLTSLL